MSVCLLWVTQQPCWWGIQPNTKVATLVFGFCHRFGLSSKILDYDMSSDGLLPNLLAFNVGVEVGQLVGLTAILIIMGFWRRTHSFLRYAFAAMPFGRKNWRQRSTR